MPNNIQGYTPNKDRIIEITSTSDTNRTWRSNLKQLLGNSSESFIERYGESLDSFVVDDNIKLLMEKDPKVFKTYNDFGKPVSEFLQGNGKATQVSKVIQTTFNAGAAILEGFTGGDNDVSKTWQPWGKDVIAWKGARGGIEFDYEFNFRLGQYGLWNAREEVVKPILNLAAPAIPRHLDAMTMTGPFPNIYQLLVKMADGAISEIGGAIENVASAVGDALAGGRTSSNEVNTGGTDNQSVFSKISSFINNTLLGSYMNFTYTVKFGNIMTFDKMLIKDASVEFSNQVDQYGYPISGKVTLSFAGMVPLALTAPQELRTTRFM